MIAKRESPTSISYKDYSLPYYFLFYSFSFFSHDILLRVSNSYWTFDPHLRLSPKERQPSERQPLYLFSPYQSAAYFRRAFGNHALNCAITHVPFFYGGMATYNDARHERNSRALSGAQLALPLAQLGSV